MGICRCFYSRFLPSFPALSLLLWGLMLPVLTAPASLLLSLSASPSIAGQENSHAHSVQFRCWLNAHLCLGWVHQYIFIKACNHFTGPSASVMAPVIHNMTHLALLCVQQTSGWPACLSPANFASLFCLFILTLGLHRTSTSLLPPKAIVVDLPCIYQHYHYYNNTWIKRKKKSLHCTGNRILTISFEPPLQCAELWAEVRGLQRHHLMDVEHQEWEGKDSSSNVTEELFA